MQRTPAIQDNKSTLSPSEESPPATQSDASDSPSFNQLVRQLLEIISSPDYQVDGEPSFQDEIAALRAALQRLQESFSQVDTLEEQLKLTAAINHLTSSLTRLVRAQEYLRPHLPSAFNQAVDRAIDLVLKEWGWQ